MYFSFTFAPVGSGIVVGSWLELSRPPRVVPVEWEEWIYRSEFNILQYNHEARKKRSTFVCSWPAEERGKKACNPVEDPGKFKAVDTSTAWYHQLPRNSRAPHKPAARPPPWRPPSTDWRVEAGSSWRTGRSKGEEEKKLGQNVHCNDSCNNWSKSRPPPDPEGQEKDKKGSLSATVSVDRLN